MSDDQATVCLDFDGVLHRYSKGWHDGTIYDPPVEGAVSAVQTLAEKYRLVISTCRLDISGVSEWVVRHFGLYLPVTNAKPVAAVYVDDRGLHFDGSWARAVEEIDSRLALG